jgi:hypothetical protein
MPSTEQLVLAVDRAKSHCDMINCTNCEISESAVHPSITKSAMVKAIAGHIKQAWGDAVTESRNLQLDVVLPNSRVASRQYSDSLHRAISENLHAITRDLTTRLQCLSIEGHGSFLPFPKELFRVVQQ